MDWHLVHLCYVNVLVNFILEKKLLEMLYCLFSKNNDLQNERFLYKKFEYSNEF